MTEPTLGPLTRHLVRASRAGDLYPAHQCYANECERLLGFLDGHGQLISRFWPKLIARAHQRDEALNEARVAYFLSSLGYPVVGWEVTDAPPRNVEFEISLGDQTGFIEVKSPGWESELSPAERIAGRTRQAKHVNLEARHAKPVEIIRRTVDKALPKFSGKAPSLLVISDDCFVNLGDWGWGPATMALTQRSLGYGDGLFQRPGYRVLGGVALFWIEKTDPRDVHYASICVPNPNATSAALPSELVSRLCTLPTEPAPRLIQPVTGRWL